VNGLPLSLLLLLALVISLSPLLLLIGLALVVHEAPRGVAHCKLPELAKTFFFPVPFPFSFSVS